VIQLSRSRHKAFSFNSSAPSLRRLVRSALLWIGELKRQDERHGQRGAWSEDRDLAQRGRDCFVCEYKLTPVEVTTAGRVVSNPAPLRHSHQELPASKLTGTSRSHSGTPKLSSIRCWRFQAWGAFIGVSAALMLGDSFCHGGRNGFIQFWSGSLEIRKERSA
jgi:hypothetical protein